MYQKKSSVSGELIPLVECYANFVNSIHEMLFNRPMTITSIRDGKHMNNSLHYVGKAFDVRIRDLEAVQRSKFVSLLKTELDNRLDIILEKDHIHVEYDPK